VNGLSDPEGMLADVQQGGKNSMAAEWWRKSMGAENKEHMRKISPLRHVEQVRIPVLLIHGIEDTIVPVEQSRTLNSRLQRARRDVRYVELSGDDHWLSSAPTRTQMLKEIETFLAGSLDKGGTK
jgi:dipeptidyl aminopeptidase/acylaminoacyl peptidase